jgi:hypothetical protein
LAADRVLIDTTVWIEHFRSRSYPLAPLLVSLREQGRACTCGVIIAELLQGSRSDRDSALAMSLAETTTVLADSMAAWERAGRLAALLRRKGQTIALLDCYLAALAVDHGAAMLSLDRHFKVIARHFPLETAA